jgi:hypothetical protein
MPSGAITLHGGQGSDTISFAFTAQGTHTLAYTQAFAGVVNNLLSPTSTGGGGQGVVFVDQGGLAAAPRGDSVTPVYDLVPVASVSGAPFTISTAGYVVDSIGGAVLIDGDKAGGDTVLVAAINAATTFKAEGSANQVIFVDGNNTYDGTSADLGNDTVVAGSGFDTINTGFGATTVNSGTGDATIYLNDTGASAFNDHVWLDDGSSTVYANGTGDAVVATKEGQTIYGGTLATASLSVVLLPNSDGTANGNDLVSAGAGTTTVFDSSSNNTVLAGSGNLYFVAAANTSASVVSGTGNVYAFGGDGGSTTLSGAAGTAYYVASTGNETLNGAGFNGALYAYGGDSTSNDSFTGGNGRDVFTAGSGNETFTGGTGGDIYQFVSSESAGTSITITDFGAGSNNTVILNGFTAQDLATLTSGGTEAGGNYTVTIGNSLTITFDNISGGSALSGHIITF